MRPCQARSIVAGAGEQLGACMTRDASRDAIRASQSAAFRRVTMSKRILVFALLATAGLASAPSALALGVQDLIPDSPLAGEPAVAVLPLNGCEGFLGARTVNGAIRIEIGSGICGVPPPRAPSHITLGRLPAGTYPLEVIVDGRLQVPEAGDITSLVVRPAPDALSVDFGGIWWDRSRPGTGVFVGQQATGATFIAWFTQDAAGPTFYTLQGGQWFGDGSAIDAAAGFIYANGRLYRTRSSPIGQPFVPESFSTQSVGTAALRFSGSTKGRLEFSFDDGRTGSLPLVRFPY
jgi:hypothetical protein